MFSRVRRARPGNSTGRPKRHSDNVRGRWAPQWVSISLPIIALFLAVAAGEILGAREGGLALLETLLFPILVAALLWGNSGAYIMGTATAAIVSPLGAYVWGADLPALGGFPWVVQAAIYVSFAGLMATVFRDRPDGVITRSKSDSNASVDFDGYESLLASLANTVEVRDHHTQGHCERVAYNSLILGRELEISGREQSILYWAARLHDLGKIAVPEYILLKSGRLSEEEFAEIRRHPAYGADLLSSVSADFRPIADVVRAHHERWDGLGYPLGYRGHEIPRLARIIAIVDVFEALTSVRPYRSPMPAAQALQYVRNGAGTQFDPELVEVFVALFHRGLIHCAAGLVEPADGKRTSSDRLVFKGV